MRERIIANSVHSITTLTQEELKRVLRYSKTTGYFTWRVMLCNRGMPGTLAGKIDEDGYVKIGVHKKAFFAHRLAFLYVLGSMPSIVDHRNGVRVDNRWKNLRPGTPTLNKENQRKACKNNLSAGMLGVSGTPYGTFVSRIKVARELKYLGTYSTAQEAHQVYLRAKRQLHSGCTI